MEFRVTLTTNPKKKLESADELLPNKECLDDHENIDVTTELLKVSPFSTPKGLLAYLRSVLMVKNFDDEDKKYIMVSSPRILKFELLVLDFAS